MHPWCNCCFFQNCREKMRELYENSFLRFLFVGGLGTVVNILIFFIFADTLHFDPTFSSVIAFLFAVTQNYILNHVWSFKNIVNFQLNKKSYFKYVCVNIFGLVINLLVLNMILLWLNPAIKTEAQLFGVLSGTIFNFILSRMYVFKENP
ncbi:GtrA family protein [Methanoregula sp.]|uniref:GtrA family protein n=2 Tax=Methanoregula sp. TaxID=2052170 RepID=UPI003BB06DC3